MFSKFGDNPLFSRPISLLEITKGFQSKYSNHNPRVKPSHPMMKALQERVAQKMHKSILWSHEKWTRDERREMSAGWLLRILTRKHGGQIIRMFGGCVIGTRGWD